MWEFARILFYPVFGSVVMGAVVYAARRRIDGIPLAAELVVLVITGMVVYAGVLLLLERQLGIGLDRLYRLLRREAN